ncbi:hypothetical protein BDZ45DRAFT_546876, partial [Acephala macrosclerotiorum]
EEQQARFNMWAANLGVFAGGHASIDHRLRDSSKTYHLIFQLLDALCANLEYCKLNEYLDSKFSHKLLSEAYLDIEGAIDRLNRLSTSIRRLGIHQSDGRAEEFIPKDENGQDMTPGFKRFAALVIGRDIPQASELLRERVLESVSRRWRRFLYRRKHQEKLSRVAKHVEITLPTISQPLHPERNTEDLCETQALVSKEDTPEADQSSAPAMSSTKASTLKSKELSTVAPSEDNSSQITRSSMSGNKLDIPKPPKSSIKNNVFECPYCRILCPVKEASGSRWKEHFIRDLAPYICTFEECDKPQHAFRTSDDWITHMVREHMLVEWICLMHTSGSTFSTAEELVFPSEDDYIQHMRQIHGDSLAEKQLPMLAQISQRPVTDIFKFCQFCGGIPDSLEHLKQDPISMQQALQKHVGTHLQSLAMISLP